MPKPAGLRKAPCIVSGAPQRCCGYSNALQDTVAIPQAKGQAECYDYLFEAAVRLRQLGVDISRPPPPPPVGLANGAASAALLESTLCNLMRETVCVMGLI